MRNTLSIRLNHYGGGTNTKRVIYWSRDSLQDVQRYYETIVPSFRAGDFTSGDMESHWLMSGSSLDGTPAAVDDEQSRVCQYTQRYTCITLSLVDLAQQGSLEIPATVSWIGSDTANSILDKLNTLPAEGVLIVYTYYVKNY